MGSGFASVVVVLERWAEPLLLRGPQLNGAMELGEAMLKAADLVAEAKGARETAFGFISDV